MVPHTGGPERNLVIWREIHALAQVGESVLENTLICQGCKYEFPNTSSRCPECSWLVPPPRAPRKKAMTRAEVDEEEARLRSKLRDNEWTQEMWRFGIVFVIGSVAIPVLGYFKIAPDWALQVMAGGLILVAMIFIRQRYQNEQCFESWLEAAEKAEYMLCPDCVHDLRGNAEKGKSEVTCPECARQLVVGDLKEIWTEKG